MAVSGRKLSDIQDSASLSSAEDFDNCFEPCLTIGQHVEAHGFCVECQEYLCRNCFECHKRTKASRNHQLLDKDNLVKHVVTGKDSEECTEKCSVHSREIIKFFCQTHEALGCNDCIILGHRTCKVDYIPDKCAGIGDSEKYRDIMGKLNEKMKDAEDIMKKAKVRDKEIDNCHAGIIKEILNFRKEINERLDQLQQDILKDADKKKFKDKKVIEKVLDEIASISTEIKKLQSSLQASKNARQDGQLYIYIKRAECKLKSDEVKTADEHLAKSDMQYSFERNTDLENILSKDDTFGKLNLSPSLVVPMKKKIYKEKYTLTHKEDIDISTKSDKCLCVIRGCAVLSSNKLVLADSNNKKLLIVDIYNKAVIEEKGLDSEPWDITAVSRDHFVVTLPDERAVYLMSTSS
ncbi:transcription intermediary factor 1-alpha-like [Mercenaria mercenaria]|uniref:transcription intermediary factor 1-alpha-like n=1 Tax=Mercenaria mercenaria TaxID=6596 RepID=UPI00234EF476|nr:transcription intermediary factor 1-alpha-like [Mercenaria mercenaria]XP_045176390.2 transcription intermediary factor 1-alpha-like [Mercenaria mercenaria]